eukprot:CAMPEP_0203883218 /NCGR_PEP_ID=MMETSP0359-20131031/27331_1 /ASSEMBLY_ACC=CAM_ASM_000338 /TAXON_ID=268821 /ORGANISM="Scrippsiella Hangoei, Strain SHTV-5" /LENGTH=392 /DNA_ID=CAMNT_0050803393 /DNA_START=31 /DNA_END=1206 /DNA_ORIENTATION=+
MTKGALLWACGWCWVGAKVILLSYVGLNFGICSVWDWAWEPLTSCQRPLTLPANVSGIKVLVYAPAKTGTKSMTKALLQLGFGQTFHSEDVLASVWAPLADAFWRRPENGAALPFATVWPPALKSTPYNPTTSDLKVLGGLEPGALATELQRCGVEAVAFDGLEELFWPIFDASPEAKVVSLNWRTWPQYKHSHEEWDWDLSVALWLLTMVGSPVHLLPWSVLLLPLLELLSDNDVHRWLSTGGPPLTSGGAGVARRFFWYNTSFRRWMTHIKGGLERRFANEAEYIDYFAEARRRVPAERFFEWDMSRHSMEDLCKFLDISEHPACAQVGPLTKGTNLLYVEREEPLVTLALLPLYLVLHWGTTASSVGCSAYVAVVAAEAATVRELGRRS